MEAHAQACTLRDWASLIHAVAWPVIVATALVLFKPTLTRLFLSITAIDLYGVKLSTLALTTKTTTQAILSADSAFDRIENLLDWNKLAAEVTKWAIEKKAINPSDMGINNFRRFLFDVGLPGGQDVELEYDDNGILKYK